MTCLLVATLAVVVGWFGGHRTARVHIVPLCTSCEAAEAALLADERQRFDQLVTDLDQPDQHDAPRSSTT